ncbi:LysM domain-containing protein [Trichoderma harzianum]|uniref:LysM domain-containing protein n=1 Tax=Trichoderma harzianum TaxID=5544 RepID=A0A0F9Z7E3_TRIHA|nr:LysM domain-containing protein [Trichoderma harzianum]
MMAPTLLKAGLLLLLSQLQLTWAADTSSVSPPARKTGSPTLPTGVTRPSDAATDCNLWWLIEKGVECPEIETGFGLRHTEFHCSNLEAGKYCCVGVPSSSTFSIPMSVTNAPTKGITTASTNGITTSTKGVSTPAAIQTGMTTKCEEFYEVADNDNCFKVAAKYNIPLETLYSWNPAIGPNCAFLQLGYSVCVKETGYKPQTGAATMATMTTLATVTKKTNMSSVTSSTATATPTPFQTGMVNNCIDFWYVTPVDTCYSIAQAKKKTIPDIKKWNPGVKEDCSELWLNNWICTGVSA